LQDLRDLQSVGKKKQIEKHPADKQSGRKTDTRSAFPPRARERLQTKGEKTEQLTAERRGGLKVMLLGLNNQGKKAVETKE